MASFTIESRQGHRGKYLTDSFHRVTEYRAVVQLDDIYETALGTPWSVRQGIAEGAGRLAVAQVEAVAKGIASQPSGRKYQELGFCSPEILTADARFIDLIEFERIASGGLRSSLNVVPVGIRFLFVDAASVQTGVTLPAKEGQCRCQSGGPAERGLALEGISQTDIDTLIRWVVGSVQPVAADMQPEDVLYLRDGYEVRCLPPLPLEPPGDFRRWWIVKRTEPGIQIAFPRSAMATGPASAQRIIDHVLKTGELPKE